MQSNSAGRWLMTNNYGIFRVMQLVLPTRTRCDNAARSTWIEIRLLCVKFAWRLNSLELFRVFYYQDIFFEKRCAMLFRWSSQLMFWDRHKVLATFDYVFVDNDLCFHQSPKSIQLNCIVWSFVNISTLFYKFNFTIIELFECKK